MRYAKKSLGQNYLVDSNIVKKIINLTNINNKNVLEIGPGKGALTKEILKNKPKSLILIEKDNILFNELKLQYKDQKNIIIYNKDVLKFNFEDKLKNTIIFGNLPYNISSQILAKIIKLMKYPPNYSALIFMFQKEMAQRIVGRFNTSKYGRLSILANYRLKILSRFDVSPNCFFPKPKITSTVLYLKPNTKKFEKIRNLENLEKITNILFSSKRKMINKSIKKIFNIEQLDVIKKNLDLKRRPSELRPEKYYELTKYFESLL